MKRSTPYNISFVGLIFSVMGLVGGFCNGNVQLIVVAAIFTVVFLFYPPDSKE